MPSIFVQIPAYHDLEIIKTLESLNFRSSGENVINVGVHFNYYNELPAVVEKSLTSQFSKIKVSTIFNQAPVAIGPSISRYIANSFYDDEDFYLQIDSHMKFRPNWDLAVLADFEKLSSMYKSKIAISEYPYSYMYDDVLDGGWNYEPRDSNVVEQNDIDWIGHIVYKKIKPSTDRCKYRNITDNRHNHVSGAFLFSDGSMHEIYTTKPNVLIEETILSMKLVSSGYKVVGPLLQVVKHMNAHPFMRSEKGFDNKICDEYIDMLKEYPRRLARIDYGHINLNNNDWNAVQEEISGKSKQNNFLFNGMSFNDYLEICSLEISEK